MRISHVAYGLRLATNIALPGLPIVHNSGVYDVRLRLKEWATFPTTFREFVEILYTSEQDTAAGQPNLRVGVLPGGDYVGFFYGDEVRFAVERRGREVWGDWPEHYTLEDACTYLLGPILGFLLRLRNMTCLHASAIATGGHALALVGLPGAGKSTTAAAFAQRGYSVIADDVVALTDAGEDFLVQPGYPRLNLWPDSVRTLFGSEDVLPRITPTWDKRYLALGNNGFGFVSNPLPLGAIYLLGPRRAALASPVVEAMAGSDTLLWLVANTYMNYLLDRNMRSLEFDLLSRLVARIPVRRVRPPADATALFELCDAIASDAKRVVVSNSFERHSEAKPI